MSINSRDINKRANQNNTNVSCNTCGRAFNTSTRLLLHLNACRREQQEKQYQQSVTNEDRGKCWKI